MLSVHSVQGAPTLPGDLRRVAASDAARVLIVSDSSRCAATPCAAAAWNAAHDQCSRSSFWGISHHMQLQALQCCQLCMHCSTRLLVR